MTTLVELLKAIKDSGKPYYTRRDDGSIHLSINLGLDVPDLLNALNGDQELVRELLLSAYSATGAQLSSAQDIIVQPEPAIIPTGPRTIRLTLGERSMNVTPNVQSVVAGKTNNLILPPAMFAIFELVLAARERQIALRSYMVVHAFENYKGDPLVVTRTTNSLGLAPAVTALLHRHHKSMLPLLVMPRGHRSKGHVHAFKPDIQFEVIGSVLSADEINAALTTLRPRHAKRPVKGRDITATSEPGTEP